MNEAASWLQVALLVATQQEGREAGGDCARVQHLVRDAVAARDGGGAVQEVGLAVVPGPHPAPGHHQESALLQEDVARSGFQLAPDRVRALDERHVGFPLADRDAGDTGFTVARTHRVRWREPVEAHCRHAAPGKLVKDSRAHRTQADDGHLRPCRAHTWRPCSIYIRGR